MGDNNIIKDFYSAPQLGSGFAVYSGSRRQIGGSFLSGLARLALPILKFFGARALNVAKNVASDVILDKQPIKQAIKKRGLQEVQDTIIRMGRSRRGSGVNMYINKGVKRKRLNKIVKKDIASE